MFGRSDKALQVAQVVQVDEIGCPAKPSTWRSCDTQNCPVATMLRISSFYRLTGRLSPLYPNPLLLFHLRLDQFINEMPERVEG